jgi:acyl-CoA dehydrogenase
VVLLQPRCRPGDGAGAHRRSTPAGLKGISLFLLPRSCPTARTTRYRILRLKDKLGTRSMASGEIRLEGAQAYLVGQPAAASSTWPT